jgi:hypothetical protein
MSDRPNFKRLVAHRLSVEAVPAGGGLAAALDALTTPDKLAAIAASSRAWVAEAIAVVKTAPDNPFGDDDELIAGEVLRLIEERKGSRPLARETGTRVVSRPRRAPGR